MLWPTDVVVRKVGRAAVAHDAGADPVGAHAGVGRMPERGSAVGQRPFARQVLRRMFELGELVRDAALAIGVRKVRHQ
jgi:hypothetical protein